MNLKDIAIGILHGELPPLSDGELAAERLKVCVECSHFRKTARQCDLCSCFMDLKTKMLEATCPAGKW